MFNWIARLWHKPAESMLAQALEARLGVQIRQPHLYEQAFTHISYERERAGDAVRSYERLEFLGDAVLGLVVADHLYRRFPDEMEGFLTPLRARIVSRKACERTARRLNLGPYLRLSHELEARGGRRRGAILADCLESLVGAVYVDQGLAAARDLIQRHVLDAVDLDDLAAQDEDFKSQLQKHAQARGWDLPEYHVKEVAGPPHDRIFTIHAYVNGKSYGEGSATSKKRAEQKAARKALATLAQAHAAGE